MTDDMKQFLDHLARHLWLSADLTHVWFRLRFGYDFDTWKHAQQGHYE